MEKIPTTARLLALAELSELPSYQATAFCDAAACLIERGEVDSARIVLSVVIGYVRAQRALTALGVQK